MSFDSASGRAAKQSAATARDAANPTDCANKGRNWAKGVPLSHTASTRPAVTGRIPV